MKIIIINTVYKYGSTGKLSYHFGEYLKQNGHDVKICFGIGDEADAISIKTQTKIERWIHAFLSRLTGLQGFFSFVSTRKLLNIIRDFQPNIIYLGNLHGNYLNIYDLFDCLKEKKIPLVQLMWDEYAFTGKCVFTYDCNKFQGLCDNCHVIQEYPKSWFFDTSHFLQFRKKNAYTNPFLAFVGAPYTAEKARNSFLLKDKLIFSLDEAVDTDKIYYPRNIEKMKMKMGIPKNNIVILNVCPYPDKRKGGEFFLKLARRFELQKDITFVHVGFCGHASECPSNYIPLGYISDQGKMAEYYSLGDLFVCTSRAETQPNTCLEALSCGTPICGFNISGIPTCAEYPFGRYVDFGDVDALEMIVKKAKRKNEKSISAVRGYAISRFSIQDYNRKLLEIGYKMINQRSELD